MIHPIPAPVIAAALFDVFACTPHAFDSLETWLAVTDEARHQILIAPGLSIPPRWIPVFLVYCEIRTDAEYHPATSTLRITSGPLIGTTYPYAADDDTAARAVAATHPYLHDTIAVVPTWRLDTGQATARVARAQPPVPLHDARHLMTW